MEGVFWKKKKKNRIGLVPILDDKSQDTNTYKFLYMSPGKKCPQKEHMMMMFYHPSEATNAYENDRCATRVYFIKDAEVSQVCSYS